MVEWQVNEFVIMPSGERKPMAALMQDERESLADSVLRSWAKAVIPDGFKTVVKRRQEQVRER